MLKNIILIISFSLLCACSTLMFLPNAPLETYDVYIGETTPEHILKTFGTGKGVVGQPRICKENNEEGMCQTIFYLTGRKSGLNLCVNKNKFRECHAMNLDGAYIQDMSFKFFNGILIGFHTQRWGGDPAYLSELSYVTAEWKNHAFPPNEKGRPSTITTNQHYKEN